MPDKEDVILPAQVLAPFKAGQKGKVRVQKLEHSKTKGAPPTVKEYVFFFEV